MCKKWNDERIVLETKLGEALDNLCAHMGTDGVQ